MNRRNNVDRFRGFADIYDKARPQCPPYVINVVRRYLGRNPGLVVDLGCGTGLSTLVWGPISTHTVGIEPNAEMIAVARKNSEGIENIEFRQEFANETTLADRCADVVTCSQSFHWMEPRSTLHEVNRILKPNCIFLAYDADWPPVCNREAELAYQKLFGRVHEIETTNPLLKDDFIKWDKENHLDNIKSSGYFTFVREIVFANRELCGAKRLISLALSQGGLQSILKKQPGLISDELAEYENKIKEVFEEKEFEIDFCYRMRIGIK